MRGKSKETFDLRAVFWGGPGANLLYLFRFCSNAFLRYYMSEVQNPFLEEKILNFDYRYQRPTLGP